MSCRCCTGAWTGHQLPSHGHTVCLAAAVMQQILVLMSHSRVATGATLGSVQLTENMDRKDTNEADWVIATMGKSRTKWWRNVTSVQLFLLSFLQGMLLLGVGQLVHIFEVLFSLFLQA